MNTADAFDQLLCTLIGRFPTDTDTLFAALNLMRAYIAQARMVAMSFDRTALRLAQLDVSDNELLEKLEALTH